jgi:hypothetical protein
MLRVCAPCAVPIHGLDLGLPLRTHRCSRVQRAVVVRARGPCRGVRDGVCERGQRALAELGHPRRLRRESPQTISGRLLIGRIFEAHLSNSPRASKVDAPVQPAGGDFGQDHAQPCLAAVRSASQAKFRSSTAAFHASGESLRSWMMMRLRAGGYSRQRRDSLVTTLRE